MRMDACGIINFALHGVKPLAIVCRIFDYIIVRHVFIVLREFSYEVISINFYDYFPFVLLTFPFFLVALVPELLRFGISCSFFITWVQWFLWFLSCWDIRNVWPDDMLIAGSRAGSRSWMTGSHGLANHRMATSNGLAK